MDDSSPAQCGMLRPLIPSQKQAEAPVSGQVKMRGEKVSAHPLELFSIEKLERCLLGLDGLGDADG